MELLSYQDLETLVAALGILLSDITLDSLPERTLAAVSLLIPIELVSFDGFDVAAHYTQTQWHNNGELLTPENLEIFPHVVHEHPLIPEVMGKNRQDVMKITDVISQAEYENTEIYNEFFGRMRLPYLMGMALPVAPDYSLSCGIARGSKDFTERERLLLNIFTPHLLAAIRNAYFVQRLEQNAARLETVVDSLPVGAVLLSADGEVQFLSETARKILEKYFANERFKANDLPVSLRYWIFAQNVSSEGGTERLKPPVPLIIKIADGELRIGLTYNSRTNEQMLMLTEKKYFTAHSLVRLGLTKRETEILFLMIEGKTNTEIAGLCVISPLTVKKHAENIYLKLNVENRTAAVRKALETNS